MNEFELQIWQVIVKRLDWHDYWTLLACCKQLQQIEFPESSPRFCCQLRSSQSRCTLIGASKVRSSDQWDQVITTVLVAAAKHGPIIFFCSLSSICYCSTPKPYAATCFHGDLSNFQDNIAAGSTLFFHHLQKRDEPHIAKILESNKIVSFGHWFKSLEQNVDRWICDQDSCKAVGLPMNVPTDRLLSYDTTVAGDLKIVDLGVQLTGPISNYLQPIFL